MSILKFKTDKSRRRLIGITLALILLALFFSLNRIPKIDTIDQDLAIVSSGTSECFQGFCIDNPDRKPLLERWWTFSVEYLRNVTIGMIFAFLMAGITEAYLFPVRNRQNSFGSGLKGVAKGVLIGPVVNLCSACIVPVANGFRRTGSGIDTTIAITQSSATMNFLALVMAAIVFAPTIAGTRILLSIGGAFVIGPLVAWIVRITEKSDSTDEFSMDLPELENIQYEDSWAETIKVSGIEFIRSTAGYFLRLAPIMIIAGFLSGLAIQWVSPNTVTLWIGDDVFGILVVATIGILINVPLIFEIPLVAAMLLAGMGTAPAGTLLFVAAAGGPITFWGLAKVMPKKAVIAMAISTWSLGVIGGILLLLLTTITEDRTFKFRETYEDTDNSSSSVISETLHMVQFNITKTYKNIFDF
tara:strand:- start:193669 stop:194913 length:1245 start_codon:yes stop_codon:yes gene_type:complete